MPTNQPNYAKRWALDHSRGVQRYRDIERARAHVHHLIASGLNVPTIAEKSGLSISGVNDIKRGRRPRVQLRIEQAILAVSPADAERDHPKRLRDAAGTRRRARALVSNGYSIRDIARRVGLFHNSFRQVVRGDTLTCEQATHEAVANLFADLWDTPGPSIRARNWAESQRWPMPLDIDESVDDPSAPEPFRDDTKAARGADIDEWLFLVRGGEDPERAAKRMGVSVHAIEGQARRKNRPEVLALVIGAVDRIKYARELERKSA